MIFSPTVLALASLPLIVNAAPSTRATSIATDCTDVKLQSGYLVANCLTGQGTERIQSTVWLPTKITNREGNLEWKVKGAYANSCTDCQILEGAKLNCMCQPTTNPKKNATLNLEEHIKNYNGHLLSDVAGPPQIPTTNSPITIPADASYKLNGGGHSCYSTDPEKYCGNVPPAQDATCTPNDSITSSSGAPSACFTYRIPISTPIWYQFQSLRIEAPSKAFAVDVYDNLDCTGAAVGTISSDETGTCKKFSKSIVGIKVTPLWNADVS